MPAWQRTLWALAALTGCGPSAPPLNLSELAERLVTGPKGLAVVAEVDTPPGVPPTITFGGPLGKSALYLSFPRVWEGRGRPVAAFVRLTPQSGALFDPTPTQIEAWRVRDAWPASDFVWAAKPALAPPYASAVTVQSTSLPLRIDVSEIVSYLDLHPGWDHGLALIGSAGDGPGQAFATGTSGDAPPALEVYLR